MIQSKLEPKVRNWVVIGVHLLSHIPVLPCSAIAKLLDPTVAKMVLTPPSLVSLPRSVHSPGLTLQAALSEFVKDFKVASVKAICLHPKEVHVGKTCEA